MSLTRAMHNLTLAIAVSCSVAAVAPAADLSATPRSPAQYDQLARAVFAQLVGMNTTHAKGSAEAAEALAARFKAAGFADADVYVGGPRPDKMNIVVRLRGRGKGKPVLFNAHLDVVEAARETWSVEPFELTEKDGFFYGRGTIDIKNEVAILTANLIRLKQEGFKANRDIIVVFNADEEAGGDANGVDWLLKNRRDLVDAGLAINHDAGNGEELNGARLWNTIQTAEKVYATYSLTAHGTGGHSSLPPRDNAIFRLSHALARLGDYQFPVRISETTHVYLEAAASRVGGDRAAQIRAVLKDPADSAAADALRDVPVINAQLRSTCPATVVEAGQSESALPIQAKATIQCRLLPGTNPDEVLATLKRVIDDPSIDIGVIWAPVATAPAVLDKAVVAKVEKVTNEMWPGLKVVPVMSSGASDNVYWRGAGIPTFGVSGTFVDVSDLRAHGKDERVGVTAFYESLEFSYRLIKVLAGP